jgi:hypothetical protein
MLTSSCTVHGTNNTVVQYNACYQFIGHGYFLEDGVETGNLIDGNLGAYAVRYMHAFHTVYFIHFY